MVFGVCSSIRFRNMLCVSDALMADWLEGDVNLVMTRVANDLWVTSSRRIFRARLHPNDRQLQLLLTRACVAVIFS